MRGLTSWTAALALLLGFAIVAQLSLTRLEGLWGKGDPDFLKDLGYTCTLLLMVQGALLIRWRRIALPLSVALCLPSALLALFLAALGDAGKHARTFLALPPVLFLLFRRGAGARQKPVR